MIIGVYIGAIVWKKRNSDYIWIMFSHSLLPTSKSGGLRV